MGSNGAENVSVFENNEDKGSETTVEIKIMTLDSNTYNLRVDKRVPVPALKEQIATVTGILSEQQRLLCRGKVLKDDQLLSAYHVEDGHTLHLVVRQPIAPLGENASDNPATDPASVSGYNEESGVDQSVLVASFDISDQGDGIPDFGQILSAVLGSIGITSTGSGSEEITFDESAAERAYTISGRQQTDQPSSNTRTASYPSDPHSDPLQPQVIPGSLETMTQYLRHMRQECDTIDRGQNNTSQTARCGVGAQDFDSAGTLQAGLPTPASMAEVLMSTRQLLNEQIEEFLLQVARYMENQANVTDPIERSNIQAYAFRSGRLVQNLGALLLELGRSMMTLQMGPAPADAVVNAGPALFVSTTGPNPMMVQPQPFLPGTSSGAGPIGTSQQSSGFGGGSVGTGSVPRNIDIRIRSAVDRSDLTGSPPNSPPNNTPTHVMNSEGHGHSSTRELEMRFVDASDPDPVVPGASDTTRASLEMFYPVLARVHVSSGDSNVSRSSQVSDQHAHIVGNGRSSMPNPAVQPPNTGLPDLDSSNISVGGMPSGQGFSNQLLDGLNQLLGTVLSGEHQHGENIYAQHVVAASENTIVAPDVNNSQETTLPTSEDGVLLSNILHQIMPLISGTIGTPSNVSSFDGENASLGSTQVPSSSEQGSSSCQQQDPLLPPSPKRQKRE